MAAVEAYLQSLADNGATILRFMLEYAHGEARYFEKPVGRFVPAMVQMWDDLFDLCEKVGLRILLTPWDNFWMANRWHKHPYNALNGGPAAGPGSFFTDEATIEASIRRFEFVVERYANRPVLAAWDLFNEIHPYWGGSPEQQIEVLTHQSKAIRAAEQRVQGWTRLQTVSMFGPNPEGGYEEMIFRHPCLDFCTTHIYYKGAIDLPRETVNSAVAMAKWTRHGLANTPAGRPFTDTEHGPIRMFNNHKRWHKEAFDAEYERHLMWAHLASGGAGSGMRWPARHPHLLTPSTRAQYEALALFSKEIDWRTFTPQDWRARITVSGPNSRDFHRFAVGDGNQIVVFLLRRAPQGTRGVLPPLPPLEGLNLWLRGLNTGNWQVTLFDPRRGCVLEKFETGVKGTLGVALPGLEQSVAVAARRLG
jgi:mannan endo-1,4-beta-mannosidase